METPLNRYSFRIEAKKINLLPYDTSPNRKVFPNRPKKVDSQFLVHKRSLPNHNPNYTVKR